MTKCAFFVIDVAGQAVEILGVQSFDSYNAARKVLLDTVAANIDVIESFNGYLAMVCQIYN